MYPAALYKNPTQTVVSSQFFDGMLLQKLWKIDNKLAESWDKKTVTDLEEGCPKHDHDFLSWSMLWKTILRLIFLDL